MPHGDRDDRLLAAIRGEAVQGEDRDEVFELRAALRVGAVARTIEADVPSDLSGLYGDAPALTSFDDIAAALGDELVGPTDRAEVIPLRRRSQRAWVPTAAAAAIALLAGAAFLLRPDSQEVVDDIALDTLLEGRASAQLSRDGERFELAVDVDGLATADGYLELWLIDFDTGEMVSLGPVRDDGRYPLPEGLQPSDFPTVDVSVEPYDGDPTHSGQSVFRGTFDI